MHLCMSARLKIVKCPFAHTDTPKQLCVSATAVYYFVCTFDVVASDFDFFFGVQHRSNGIVGVVVILGRRRSGVHVKFMARQTLFQSDIHYDVAKLPRRTNPLRQIESELKVGKQQQNIQLINLCLANETIVPNESQSTSFALQPKSSSNRFSFIYILSRVRANGTTISTICRAHLHCISVLNTHCLRLRRDNNGHACLTESHHRDKWLALSLFVHKVADRYGPPEFAELFFTSWNRFGNRPDCIFDQVYSWHSAYAMHNRNKKNQQKFLELNPKCGSPCVDGRRKDERQEEGGEEEERSTKQSECPRKITSVSCGVCLRKHDNNYEQGNRKF